MCGLYGGAQIVGRGTGFSPDGKFVVTSSESGVYIYSTVTSRPISAFTKHRIVKCLTLDATDPNMVLIATSEQLILWEYLTQKRVISRDIPSECTSITDMVYSASEEAILVSCVYKGRSAKGKTVRYRLPDFILDPVFSLEHPCGCSLTVSPSGRMVCLLPERGATSAVLISTAPNAEPWNLSFPEHIHCVAFDPMERQLAATGRSGKILLYQDLSGQSRQLPTVLHWHAARVMAMRFSSDAHFLFSVGEEGVLVSWRLSDLSRKFVPRLGLNVIGMDIHPLKESLFLLSFEENSFKIIDASNYRATLAVYGIVPASKERLDRKRGSYCVQSGTGYLALPMSNCSVQFYDMAHDRHMSKLQVIPRMAISKTRQKRDFQDPSTEPYLQSIAFNPSGTVFVAVMVRSQIVLSETKTDLRFFDSDAPGKPFTLNTEILDPHKGGIAAMCCSPVDDLVVTTSERGDVRLWTRQSTERHSTWRCKAIGSYRGYPLGECCFSGDGSVLAVAYTSGVGLWDPTTLSTLGHVKFPDSPHLTHLPELSFVTGSDFLVGCVSAASLLVVWDLQSLSIHWASTLNAECLTVDSTSKRFAVCLNSHDSSGGDVSVAVFDPAESIPCAVYSKFVHPVAHLHFAQPGTPLFTAGRRMENGIKHTHAPLIVLSATHQYSIETETGSLSRKGEEESGGIEEVVSPFEMAFGSGRHVESEPMEVDSSTEDDAVRMDISSWAKIPSHALPPVSVLCSNLLDQIVDKNART